MLPDFLQSSYQTYKQDTDILAKWLAVTAKQCGYPVDLLSPSDPTTSSAQNLPSSQTPEGAVCEEGEITNEGNTREGNTSENNTSKDNRGEDNTPPLHTPSSSPDTLQDPNSPADTPKYTVKVKDFVALAECIARFDKPAVQVPVTVVNALNRAIDLRQQYITSSSARGELESIAGVEGSNDNLAHFLDILERIQETLQPRMPLDTMDDFLLKPSSRSSDRAESDTQASEQVSNMLDKLDIQGPTQTFLDAPDLKPVIGVNAVQEPDYKAEQLQKLDEQYLATYCLFQDVSSIRSFLRQLWTNYRDGNIALMAASITTNTAIDFVRILEQDFMQSFPDRFDYGSIMLLVYAVWCENRGQNPHDKQQPGDSFNFEVYDLAEEVMLPTYVILRYLQKSIRPNQILSFKPEFLGARDTTVAWTEKSDREKFEDDEFVLMEAFPDLMITALINSRFALAEDELTRGIRQMAPGKIIPLWLVFAAQCFLDTQHVLGQDTGRAHTELQRTGNAIKVSITQNLKFHESMRIESWSEPNDIRFYATLTVIEEWIRQDAVAVRMKFVSLDPAKNLEPFRLLKQYPLLCGLFSFAIQMNAHGLGIDFANSWGSILCASHLYNATRQEKLLSKAWKDLELVLALHGTENFFFDHTPKHLQECFKGFNLSMGSSATSVKRDRSEDTSTALTKGSRGLSEFCTASALFKDRYCRNEHSVTWTTESLQPIVQAKMEDDSDSEGLGKKKSFKLKTAASGSSVCGPEKNDKLMPLTDFLRHLTHALHAETLELNLDYLRMHRSCWIFLRKANEACKPELLDYLGPSYLSEESHLPIVVGYILAIASQTDWMVNIPIPKRPGLQLPSRILAQAAEAFKDMIDSGVGELEIKFLAQRPGIGQIDIGELDVLDLAKQA